MIALLMGVAGSGKTTVGELLAAVMEWEFYDADDYHSQANVGKMAAGAPLSEGDRRPWLRRLRELLRQVDGQGKSAVLACSALRARHRRILQGAPVDLLTIYLQATPELIRERLTGRTDHFMPAGLLESQLDDLEEPQDAIIVPTEWPPERIVGSNLPRLGRDSEGT